MTRRTIKNVAISGAVIVCVSAAGYLGLRAWAHNYLTTKLVQARQFALEHGNPVVDAISRYVEANGEYPSDIHEDLVPRYVGNVHAGWTLWMKPAPELSTRLFMEFDNVFLTWNFDEKSWRFGKSRLDVAGPK